MNWYIILINSATLFSLFLLFIDMFQKYTTFLLQDFFEDCLGLDLLNILNEFGLVC